MNEALSEEQKRLLLELFELESKRVHTVGLRITRNPDLAAEAFQETFLRLARWIKRLNGSLPPADSLHGLVQVMTERAATDALRRHIRTAQRVTQSEKPIPSEVPDFTGVIELERLLRHLTNTERSLVELAYQYGYSSEETGRKMGMSAAAIRVMKHRILKKLRQVLENAKGGPQGVNRVEEKHDKM